MPIRFNRKMVLGEVIAIDNFKEKTYKVKIYGGNCLAVFVHEHRDENTGEKMCSLWSFFDSVQHIKNILNNNPEWFQMYFKKVKLNLYYKESEKMLPFFVKAGVKTEPYYKEPKKPKK